MVQTTDLARRRAVRGAGRREAHFVVELAIAGTAAAARVAKEAVARIPGVRTARGARGLIHGGAGGGVVHFVPAYALVVVGRARRKAALLAARLAGAGDGAEVTGDAGAQLHIDVR